MARSRVVDLTEGNIGKQVLIFSLPILTGYILQTVYNNADSLVAGNYIGKEALAAVNVCTPVYNLLVGFFIGMSTGASVIFSRCFGARSWQKLKDSVHVTVAFALVLGIVMAVFGVLMVDQTLQILNCREDIYGMAGEYLRVYIAGILFTAFYNVGAAVLRAVGDSRSPFYALLACSILNVFLDVFNVVVLHLGVTGIALATVGAQALSVVLVFRQMMRMDERYRFSFRELHFDSGIIAEIVELGIPAGMQSCLISVSNLFVNRYINGFSSEMMAGVGVAQKLDRFILMPVQAIGLAATTFVSQNIGAKKPERLEKGIRTMILMGIISITVFGAVMYPNAERLVRLFNRDPEVVRCGADMMHCLIPCYAFTVFNQIFSGTLRRFGKARQVMFLSITGMIVVRQIYLAVFLRIFPEGWVVYMGYPVGWGVAGGLCTLYYLYLKKNGTLDAAFR